MATKTTPPKTPKPTPTSIPTPAPSVDKTRCLKIQHNANKTTDRQFADLVTEGLAASALTAMRYTTEIGDISLTDLVVSMRADGKAVNAGDFSNLEQMLAGQAVALNAMFAELARRSSLNMGEHMGAMETYLKLALKAQSQSRATVETLAAIKNPPVVFAKQANINNGGNQQVNNGAGPIEPRTGKKQSDSHELLGANNGERMDFGTPGQASGFDPNVEAVAAVNRAAK